MQTRDWTARTGILLTMAALTLGTLLIPSSQAQSFSVLYSFQGTTDGGQPFAGLIRDSSGNLYGTTEGVQDGFGTVFELDPTGKETTLWNFNDPKRGQYPEAALIRDSKGNLYSTTEEGGRYSGGTVFRLKKSGAQTVLHSFDKNNTDGFHPVAALVADAAGNFYGTTYEGGAFGWGTVFKVDGTGAYSILYSFTGKKDGRSPKASLIRDPAGNFYGTTEFGGWFGDKCADGCGVVFKLDVSGTETVLHSFDGGKDGAFPVASLVRDAAGDLYGTTNAGGAFPCQSNIGCGTVFKVSTTGKHTVLYSFAGLPDGEAPTAGLTRDATGSLYGTTELGGHPCAISLYGCGTVFELKKAQETILYTFSGGADGGLPEAGLLRDPAGNFYGTTSWGGIVGCTNNVGCGVVFKITP